MLTAPAHGPAAWNEEEALDTIFTPPNVELTGTTRQGAHAGPQTMYRVPAARRVCPAVACPVERHVRRHGGLLKRSAKLATHPTVKAMNEPRAATKGQNRRMGGADRFAMTTNQNTNPMKPASAIAKAAVAF